MRGRNTPQPDPDHGRSSAHDHILDVFYRSLVVWRGDQDKNGKQHALESALGHYRAWELLNARGAEPTLAEAVIAAKALGVSLSALTPDTTRMGDNWDKANTALNIHAARTGKLDQALKDLRALARLYGARLAFVVMAGAMGFAALNAYQLNQDHAERSQELETLQASAAQLTETARDYARRGEMSLAASSHEQAVELSRLRVQTARTETDRLNALYDLGHAVFYKADFNYRQGDTESAIAGYQEYASIGDSLVEADPSNPYYLAEQGWGDHNLAIVDFERGRLDAAFNGFTQARERFLSLHQSDDGVIGLSDIIDTMGWRAETLFAMGRFQESASERNDQLQLISQINAPSLRTQLNTVHITASLAELALITNRLEEAETLTRSGLDAAATFLDENPGNERAARHYASMLSHRSSVLIVQGDLVGAKLLLDRAPARLMHELDGDWTPPWRASAEIALSAANIALEMGAADTAIRRAESALRHLDRAETSYLDSPRLQARAYELQGAGLQIAGDEQEAREAWRHGLRALQTGRDSAREQALRARIAHRLGDTETVTTSRRALEGTEYTHPIDQLYWSSVETSTLVERQEHQD